MLVKVSIVSSLVALSTAHVVRHAHGHGEEHVEERGLPASAWYHEDPEHPVHQLFKRDAATTDGQTYAAVGSAQWSAQWKETLPSKDQLPKEWFDALDAAVAAGKIPNLAPSTQPDGPDTNPVYAGKDGASPEICSQTYQCTSNPDVIFDAPAGYFGSSFDDGPYAQQTPELVTFLQQNNVKTTHFMIGVNIFYNPQQFLTAFNAGHDIAVHTWSHPYMTTLSNEDVVAQLGYTMDIIHKSTGGRIPKYWRPPYGDSDNRVVAIAKEVFHMTTIKWNQDTEDWSIGSAGGTTRDKALSDMTGWLKTTDKTKTGLIILEHEVSEDTVAVFKSAFPLIAQNGWKFAPVTSLFTDNSPYKNAPGGLSGTVANEDILADVSGQAATSGGASSANSTAPAATGSATGSSKSTATAGSTSPSGGANANTSGSSTGSATGSAPSSSGSGKPSSAIPAFSSSSSIITTLVALSISLVALS